MPRRSERRLTKRTVDALTVETKDTVFWDRDLAGFGVRVHATGRKVYVVQSRGPAGPKRVTLGRHGALSADEARKRAAVVIDRIKRGEPPVPAPSGPELTVAALAERYLCAHVLVHCKPSTAETYRSVLDRHVLPAMGARAVGAVGRNEIAALHHQLRDTPTMANAAIDVLSKDVLAGRGVGADPAWTEPVPVGAPLQDPHARAVSDAGGVPAPGPRIEGRGGGRLGVAARNRRGPLAAADRVPAFGDPGVALGRRGPHGGGAEVAGRQGGSAHGAADPAAGGGARRHRPDAPPRANRTEAIDYDKEKYKRREKVERFFIKLR